MQLQSPQRPAPAVLVLGAPDGRFDEVAEFCRDAGVLADHAHTKEEAMRLFLARGGHEGLLCIGEQGPELASILAALREIDPELPVLALGV